VVMFAVPVAAMESSFKAVRHMVKPDVLLLDVGSTKRGVVDAARRALRDSVGCFVPCHPIAGKELAGVEHADAELFKNRQVILTPIERTRTAQLQKAQALWKALGCSVTSMSPEAHDSAYAAVSHLPHLIAFAYVNAVMGQKDGEQFLELAGPGFRDFTRIAASDPEMWRDVIMANRHELIEQIKIFRRNLDALWTMIDSENGDALEASILQASHTRLSWKLKGR
jgi:prephenate dehydrogenase